MSVSANPLLVRLSDLFKKIRDLYAHIILHVSLKRLFLIVTGIFLLVNQVIPLIRFLYYQLFHPNIVYIPSNILYYRETYIYKPLVLLPPPPTSAEWQTLWLYGMLNLILYLERKNLFYQQHTETISDYELRRHSD